jgi:hypothetical protein
VSRIPTGPKIRVAPGAVTGFGPRLGDVRISSKKDDSQTRGHPRYWSSWAEWRNSSNSTGKGSTFSAGSLDKQQHLLNAALGGLLVVLSDAGGEVWFPAQRMAEVAMVGALLTALGLGIGAGAWEIVAPAALVVTLLAGTRAAAYGTAT